MPPDTKRSQADTGDGTRTFWDRDLSRRSFLKVAGVSLTAVALPEFLTGCGPNGKTSPGDPRAALEEAVGGNPEFFVTLYRRENMVALMFGFINMSLDEAGANLIPIRTGRVVGVTTVPLIVVSHEPQPLLERAYIEGTAPRRRSRRTSGSLAERDWRYAPRVE